MEDEKQIDLEATNQRRRGRPKKNGMQSAEVLGRTLFGLHWIHKARRLKEKFQSALEFGASKTNSSVAEMKRILAKWQPKDAEVGLVTFGDIRSLSEEEAERNRLLGLPEVFWKNPKVLSFGIGPIPRYPRANARDKS
jgi:hypothetical protein